MSFYRKYRPQTFSNLVGQPHVSQTISNALKLDRVSHAYLFTGPRGTGKTSTARLLAKSINCLNVKDAEPCNSCEICQDIMDGRLIDIIEIDAASNRGIDEMRDLREKINFSPTRARSKVYIIDEVHMLTKEAFNALLKTLEEPPAHVYFILATTEVQKIPETILSRCQRFDFKRIDEKVLIDRLKFIAAEEKIEADEKALEMIAHHAEGGLRDAISLFEQLTIDGKLIYDHVCSVLGISGFASIEKLFGFLQTNEVKAALDEVHELYMDGFDLNHFTKRFLEFLRKKMLAAVNGNDGAETAKILSWINHFQEAYDQSRYATIPQLPLEVAIVKSTGTLEKDGQTVHEEMKENVTDHRLPRDHKGLAAQPQPPQVQVEKPLQNETAAPETAQKKSPQTELTSDTIQSHWGRVIEHIKNPAVKRSFQATTLLKVSGHDLTLSFPSHFHMEKLMQPSFRVEVEEAFQQVFSQSVKILGEVRKVAAEVNEAEKELEDTMKDIFQGEMV